MNITQLQRFVAAAEELHFPRAAQALGIPLPSLYSSIDKLEAEVGHPLFTRADGRVGLTQAGVLLLVEAKEQIAASPPPRSAPPLRAARPRPRRARGEHPR